MRCCDPRVKVAPIAIKLRRLRRPSLRLRDFVRPNISPNGVATNSELTANRLDALPLAVFHLNFHITLLS
jgi:hypothetical protein